MTGTARMAIAGDVDFTQSHVKAEKQALLTKLRDEVVEMQRYDLGDCRLIPKSFGEVVKHESVLALLEKAGE